MIRPNGGHFVQKHLKTRPFLLYISTTGRVQRPQTLVEIDGKRQNFIDIYFQKTWVHSVTHFAIMVNQDSATDLVNSKSGSGDYAGTRLILLKQ